MEVKIGVQNASRELTIDTTLDADGVEKAVTEALKERRRPRPHRRQGPADRRTRREAGLRRHLDQRQRAGRLPLLTELTRLRRVRRGVLAGLLAAPRPCGSWCAAR